MMPTTCMQLGRRQGGTQGLVIALFVTSFLFASFILLPVLVPSNGASTNLMNPRTGGLDAYSPSAVAMFDEVDVHYASTTGSTTNFERMMANDGVNASITPAGGKIGNIQYWEVQQTFCFTGVDYNRYPEEWLCAEVAAHYYSLVVYVGTSADLALESYVGTISTAGGTNYFDVSAYLTGATFYVTILIEYEEPYSGGSFSVDFLALCLDFDYTLEPVNAHSNDGFGSTTNFAGMKDVGSGYATLTEERWRNPYEKIYYYELGQTYRFDTRNYDGFYNESLVLILKNSLSYAVAVMAGPSSSPGTYLGRIQAAGTYKYNVHSILTGPSFYVYLGREGEYQNTACQIDYIGLNYSQPLQISWTSPLGGTNVLCPGPFEFTYHTGCPAASVELLVNNNPTPATFTKVSLGGNNWKGTYMSTVAQIGPFTATLRLITADGKTITATRQFQFVLDTLDYDGDGLSNFYEYMIGLNPYDVDSDDDGIRDPDDDVDGDLLPNAEEYARLPKNFHSDPGVCYNRSNPQGRAELAASYDWLSFTQELTVIGEIDANGYCGSLPGFHLVTFASIDPDQDYYLDGYKYWKKVNYSIDKIAIKVRIKLGDSWANYIPGSNQITHGYGVQATPGPTENNEMWETAKTHLDFWLGLIPTFGDVYGLGRYAQDIAEGGVAPGGYSKTVGADNILWSFDRADMYLSPAITEQGLQITFNPEWGTIASGTRITLEITTTIRLLDMVEEFSAFVTSHYTEYSRTISHVNYISMVRR